MGLCSDGYAQDQAASPRDREWSLNLQVLASLQSDGSYVGAPYLDRGISGVTPGIGGGGGLVLRDRFAFAVDFSTTRTIKVQQTGRLAAGGKSIGELRDPLLWVLIGPSQRFRGLRASAMVGLTAGGGIARENGVRLDEMGLPRSEGDGWLGFGAGLDLTAASRRRLSPIASVRYSYSPRSTSADQQGVGDHITRFAGGLQINF